MFDPFGSVPTRGLRGYIGQRLSRRIQQDVGRARADRFSIRAQQSLSLLRQEQEEARRPAEDPGIFQIPGVKGIAETGGTFLGGALDWLARPGQAVSGAVLGIQGGEGFSFSEGIRRGLVGTPEEREDLNFATVLENGGVENEWARNIAGIAMDMIFDPLNLLMAPVAAAGKLGRFGRALQAPGRLTRAAGRAVRDAPIPVLSVFPKAFSQRLGNVTSHYELRRLVKKDVMPQEYLDAVEDAARRLRQAGSTQAQKAFVGETAKEIGEYTAEEGVEAIQTLFRAHGTSSSVEDAMSMARSLGRGVSPDENIAPHLRRLSHFSRGVGIDDLSVRPGLHFDRGVGVEDLLPRSGPFIETPVRGILRAFERATSGRKITAGRAEEIAADLRKRGEGVYEGELKRLSSTFEKELKSLEGLPEGSVARTAAALLNVNTTSGMYARVVYGPVTTGKFAKGALKLRKRSQDSTTRKSMRRTTDPEELARQAADPESGLVSDPVQLLAFDKYQTTLLAERNITIRTIVNDRPGSGSPFRRFGEDDVVEAGEAILELNPYTMLDESELRRAGLVDDVLEERLQRKSEKWVGPEELVNIIEHWAKPKEMHGLMKLSDAFLSMWKPTVTVLFPAFFIRNGIGIVHNHLMGGVWNPKYYKDAMKLVLGSTEDISLNAGKVRLTSDEFLREAQSLNVVGAGSRYVTTTEQVEAIGTEGLPGLFNKIATAMTGQDIPKPLIDRFASVESFKHLVARNQMSKWRQLGIGGTRVPNPFAWGASLNEAMDNVGRVAHVLSKMDDGADFATAARSARKYGFAYNEAPPTASGIASAIPFFRWTYFNVPLQFESLFLKPYFGAKVAHLSRGVEHLARDLQPAAESLEAEVAMLPEWILERHHLVLGQDDDGALRIVSGFGLPIEDLNKLFSASPGDTVENVLSELSPMLRAPLELNANHSFFTGEPIRDDDRLFSFYRRSWRWIDNVPTPVGDKLREWLGFERLETASGREQYIANPTEMYKLASLVGRMGMTADRWMEIAEERDPGLAVNLLTGFKLRRAWPKRSQRVPLNTRLAQDPKLYELYKQYRSIPLYPALSADEGNTVAAAQHGIGEIRNGIQARLPEIPKDLAWELAAQEYGSRVSSEGEMLARLVRKFKLKRSGSKIRLAFKMQHPDLVDAVNELDVEMVESLDEIAWDFGGQQ